MKKSKTIHISSLGEVLLEKSARARHFSITVRPFKGVRVAVPYGASFKAAERIVRKKATLLQAHREKARAIEQKHREFKEQYGYISRAAAKGLITARLEELADKHQISYNKVFIRNQKTRWGSCSSAGNLSLNYKIALLPGKLMDYVLLHELVHIKHPNHSRHFWEELDRLAGDARAFDRQLNDYQALLVRQ